MADDEENPFVYYPHEERREVEHKRIGACFDCGDDAFVTFEVGDRDEVFCFPCAYNRASWME